MAQRTAFGDAMAFVVFIVFIVVLTFFMIGGGRIIEFKLNVLLFDIKFYGFWDGLMLWLLN